MSTDKALADVQPGGRVRLGDQAERARFEAWGRTEGLPLARGKLGGYAFEVTAKAWRAWQHLSAQPSPGGQDALIEELADDVETCVSSAVSYLASDRGWDDYGIYRDDAAARYRALPDRIRALAAPPAQAVESKGDPEAVELLNALGYVWHQGGWQPRHPLTRQPVGEPVGTVHSGKYASGMPWCEVEWHTPQPAGTKLYTAPPAQAVDLGQDDSEALLHIKTAPEPVSQPSEEWVERYVEWHDEGRRVMRRTDRG